MKRFVYLIVALAVTVSCAVAEGIYTGRWREKPDEARANDRVGDLPATIGRWVSVDRALDQEERQIRLARLDAHVIRDYTNQDTGETIQVLLVVGKPAPICGHNPQLCFGGMGYVGPADPDRKAYQGSNAATFFAGRFEQPSAPSLHIWWGFTASGPWEAPSRPEARFAREHHLYKVYLVRTPRPLEDAAVEDPVLDSFAQVFLPAVYAALYPTPDTTR